MHQLSFGAALGALGLALAMILRILLLLSISWIMSLTTPIPCAGGLLTPVNGADRAINARAGTLLVRGLFPA